MALIRYPGSKERLANKIFSRFPVEMAMPLWMDSNRWEYREPFFGAGAMGFKVLELLPPSCKVWINDADYGLVCLWQSVWNSHKWLKDQIDSFRPNVDDYNLFKEEDGRKDLDMNVVGFRKLALHQMSYSGLGAMSGGPLGGQEQSNELYRIDCRWSPENLKAHINRLNLTLNKFKNIRISCLDFSELITDELDVFVYLDPPYYEKGQQLYKYAFDESDHLRLADALKSTRNKWLLSYDDHPFIRRLYADYPVKVLETTYTVFSQNGSNGNARPKNKEIVILGFGGRKNGHNSKTNSDNLPGRNSHSPADSPGGGLAADKAGGG